MAKTRTEKEALLQDLSERLEGSKSAVLLNYQGLKVKETEELRRALKAKAVSLKVAKVSLAKIALEKYGVEADEAVYDKPFAIAFGMEDEVAPAKEIAAFAKKYEALEVLGGILEKKYIAPSAVQQLASLPSKEELYAKVVGSIAAPLSGMVNVLAGNVRGLVNVLNAYKEKKA
ncbi:MAG: 50S ribosomal protein L10 [bacterium ADurb.Bin400]|nr:MAG: 50S ribosomal protein L10 [bacterium ADurb.Bin400]